MQQLLVAHDAVAHQIAETRQKIAAKEAEHEYLYERASQYGEESIRIVRLVKGAEPLVGSCAVFIIINSTVNKYIKKLKFV